MTPTTDERELRLRETVTAIILEYGKRARLSLNGDEAVIFGDHINNLRKLLATRLEVKVIVVAGPVHDY